MKRFLSFSALIALAWSGFQLYNAYEPLHYMILRPLHVFLALALSFFVYPLSKDPEDRVRRGIDIDAGCGQLKANVLAAEAGANAL